MNDFSSALSELFPEPLTPEQLLTLVRALRVALDELGAGTNYPQSWVLDASTRAALKPWCKKYGRLCEEALGLDPSYY